MGDWDQNHHVSPSLHNKKTHIYYKQFFDKPAKNVQNHIIKYKKTLDPYLENEFKNWIPTYSTVYNTWIREKELDWVDNFAVKWSKDNNRIHQKFKEYFDMPKKYEYDWTVGKTRGIVKHSLNNGQWREHYKPTAFFLKKERGNVYKVDKWVEKSVE